jgi:hypothetical protein
MKKGKTLFIFCDGTDHDLKDDSIVARYYKLLQARAIDIRPYQSEEFDSILDGLQGEIFSEDSPEKFAHDKLYLRGCGSTTNTPGKNSPVLGKDKETVKSFLNNSANLGDFGEDFYGVNTPAVNGPVSRVVKGLAEGEGRYDNVHKACAIIAARLGDRGFQTQNKPVEPLEFNDNLLLAENNNDGKIEEEDEADEYTKIVLVGWSRGAVTVDHIRKQLFEMGITIPVCSFQIDAVAGQNAGLTDENTRCYSPAELDVRLFTRGDERQEFHPQTLERVHDIPELLANPDMPYHQLSSIKAYPVYGSHSQVAGSAKGDPSRTISTPAMITEKLLVEFFNKAIGEEETRKILGPKVDQHTDPTEPQFIELYSLTQVVPHHFEYKLGKSLFSSDIIYKKEERPFISELDKYIKHSEFFVNSDHEEKFAQCYPDLYAKIDTLTNNDIAEILETKGLDQCSKTVFITAILFKALDEQIKKIPSHKIYAQFLESMRSVRREIQKEIYTEISSAKKTPQEIRARLAEVLKHTSIAEEITEIVTENIPPTLRKSSLPGSAKEPEINAVKAEPAVLKSANPVAHLGKIKSQIENSQELFPGEKNKFIPLRKLLQAAVAAASVVLKIIGGFFGAVAGPVGLKAGVKAAERCSNRMYNSLFSSKKRDALNLADNAIAAANSASALRTPQQ